MASALISDNDADRCVAASSSRHSDVDILLRKAGLTLDGADDTAETGDDGDTRGQCDGECRVGQCRMPAVIQRLATVRSFTVMSCFLAALTGTYC